MHSKARNFTFTKQVVLLAALLFSTFVSAQTQPVNATIDASKTGAPISRYIYGQFLEHGGNIVNEGVWSELLEDRKFYHPITSKPPEEPPVPAWRRRGPPRHWLTVGADEFVTMDTNKPFTGEHTPLVNLDKNEPHGFQQSGLAVRKGKSYTGRVILAGSPGAVVKVAPAARLAAQVQTEVPPVVPGAKPMTVEHIKVHGTALEGNLEGDAVDRDVIVFLPPTYAKEKARRYPVVYALHGYSIGAEQWTHEIQVPQTIEGAFAQGAKEMIVVLPDSKTIHNGSMYSSSVTTGDFERFIAHDVVEYIDAHYRTIPNRTSRGLVGHSMGGYGATRIGMKHSDVFGSLYIMSPCCLSARTAASLKPEDEKALEAVKTPEDSAKLSFFQRAQLATAAAWSPDPKNPPLYLDLPAKGGEPNPDVLAKWAANAPLAFVDQYIGNLRQYRAVAIDVGDQDGLRIDAGKLHDVLDKYGIANGFEVYPGTHTSKVADRFQNHVIPFFSQNLCFEVKGCR